MDKMSSLAGVLKEENTLRVVIVGHVDHGKSTLIGRLLHDTGSLTEQKLTELDAISRKRGDVLEWSFLLDSFQAERDQAITIDTTQIRFQSETRNYVIIDAPGHREFLKNMISGAAQADAAILVVDAEEGLKEQTKRHAYILHLLGLQNVAVVINKMDGVGYAQARFDLVARDVTQYLRSIGITPAGIIPISARHGDNILRTSSSMPWCKDKTVMGLLDRFQVPVKPIDKPLRFLVQNVYRRADKRIVVGRVESGTLRKGATITLSPTDETATIESLECWPADPRKIQAQAGEAIGLTLEEDIYVERGHIISATDHLPMLSHVFRATLFWFSPKPLRMNNSYKIRFGTTEAMVSVQSIDKVIDTQDLRQETAHEQMPRNMVAEVTLRAQDLLPVDSSNRLVVYDGQDIAAAGTLSMEGYADQRHLNRTEPKAKNIEKFDRLVSQDMRANRFGHRSSIFWLTGLSGAGKTTLALEVEKSLFKKGYNVTILDGDIIRHGLNEDLGFSPEDRAENIRRAAHMASAIADSGTIVITAFISPYESDRLRARNIAPGIFHEIYVKADIDVCEARDPKGLYKKARRGEIQDFTGISSPYEAPKEPDLIIDTQENEIHACVHRIVRYIESQTSLKDFDNSHTRTKEMKIRAV